MTSPDTRHTSHVTRHTSHITRQTSHVTRYTSQVTFHDGQMLRCVCLPRIQALHIDAQTRGLRENCFPGLLAREELELTGRAHVIYAFSAAVWELHVTRHTSHVTRHTSHVTRHTSHITSELQPVRGVLPCGKCCMPRWYTCSKCHKKSQREVVSSTIWACRAALREHDPNRHER